MNDMSSTIVARSDQINAADLVGTSRTITIREVKISPSDDQPVSVLVEGDQKAFRPCKGVRRLMVRVWGADASKYVGQSMTLFQDPTVTWAGKPEGGIRVSHMSGLQEPITEAMRTSRAATKPYKIMPLADAPKQNANAKQTAEQWADEQAGAASVCPALGSLDDLIERGAKAMGRLETTKPDLWAKVNAAYADARAALDAPTNAPAADMGDGFADEGDGA